MCRCLTAETAGLPHETKKSAQKETKGFLNIFQKPSASFFFLFFPALYRPNSASSLCQKLIGSSAAGIFVSSGTRIPSVRITN